MTANNQCPIIATAASAIPAISVVRPSRRALTVAAASAFTGLALLGVTACGGGGRTEPDTKDPVPLPAATTTKQQMSEENFGYAWPLKVDHGTAECRKGDQAVFTVPDGTTYALNERAREAGYADIDPIRLSNDNGDKVSLGALRSRTMKLCQLTR